jgi:hypothetical protein
VSSSAQSDEASNEKLRLNSSSNNITAGGKNISTIDQVIPLDANFMNK